MNIKIITLIIVVFFTACSVFRATGESVEAVGEGAGHAVGETGRAITGAANDGL